MPSRASSGGCPSLAPELAGPGSRRSRSASECIGSWWKSTSRPASRPARTRPRARRRNDRTRVGRGTRPRSTGRRGRACPRPFGQPVAGQPVRLDLARLVAEVGLVVGDVRERVAAVRRSGSRRSGPRCETRRASTSGRADANHCSGRSWKTSCRHLGQLDREQRRREVAAIRSERPATGDGGPRCGSPGLGRPHGREQPRPSMWSRCRCVRKMGSDARAPSRARRRGGGCRCLRRGPQAFRRRARASGKTCSRRTRPSRGPGVASEPRQPQTVALTPRDLPEEGGRRRRTRRGPRIGVAVTESVSVSPSAAM